MLNGTKVPDMAGKGRHAGSRFPCSHIKSISREKTINITAHWTENEVPDQTGRTVVITGANPGLGFEAARVFARYDAEVVLACRNTEKATETAARILQETPTASVRSLALDLTSQASVRRAAEQVKKNHPRIDLLINNAGAMIRHHA